MSRWSEFDAIHAIRGAVERLDEGWEDTAALRVPGGGWLHLSSDHIAADQAYPGEDVRSLVRRGIFEAFSDLAAGGATPTGLQIDVRAPDDFREADFRAIGLAVEDALTVTGGLLLQGSNLSRGEFGMSSTVVGVCGPAEQPLRRRGARPGDVLVVSGAFGGWDGALAVLNAAAADTLDGGQWAGLVSDFLDYRPELACGAALLASGRVSSCLDCNDSLAKSLIDLSYACGHHLEIDVARVPLAPTAQYAAAAGIADVHRTALSGIAGDDRLLFTVAPADLDEVLDAVSRRTGRRPVPVGRVTDRAGAGALARQDHRPPTALLRDQPATIYLPTFSAGRRRLGLPAYPPAGRTFTP